MTVLYPKIKSESNKRTKCGMASKLKTKLVLLQIIMRLNRQRIVKCYTEVEIRTVFATNNQILGRCD